MPESKKIDIIGVPLDLGVKELGLRLGPDAFREAGLLEVARHVGLEARDLGNIEMPADAGDNEGDGHKAAAVAAWCETLGQTVAESVRAGRVPVCLGGDHSLAIGSLAGVASQVGPVGCIWMDAHPDANTPETSPSGNIHGMPVAIILGHGPEALVNVVSPGAKVAYRQMSLLGTRDMDPGEAAFIRDHEVQMFTVFDVVERGLPAVVNETIRRASEGVRGVHVSMDLDVLREDIAPGVGLPSRSGFDMREAVYICRRIAAECHVASIDIVGLNPVRDREMMTAKRAIELLMSLLGRTFTFSYDAYLQDQRYRG